MNRWFLIVPAIAVMLLAALFFRSLQTQSTPFASVLINQPAPEFDLGSIPPVAADSPVPPGLSSEDLVGSVSLVNFWGSYCIPCRIEHPVLMEAAKNGITIHGVNWKDKPGRRGSLARPIWKSIHPRRL